MSTYSEFQQKPSSEKIVLAKVQAAYRLVGWTLHSGSIYKITGFNKNIIESIEDSGVALASVGSVGLVSAGKYFNDTDNDILYLRTSDSVNPNGKFIVCNFWFFFSNAPINAPYDLSGGDDVEWMPLVQSTSEFGTNLDTKDQLGTAIEGTGSIKFINDKSFWQPIYDKITFENKRIYIYSWSFGLPITEAKLIFVGQVTGKSYAKDSVEFQMKDAFNELRALMDLPNIGDIGGALVPDDLLLAKQRRIYGYVYGLKPTNIDQVLSDGYEITGTADFVAGSDTVTGSGTSFLNELAPDDEISIDGSDFVSIKSVESNTSLTLSDPIDVSFSGNISVKPSKPKRYTNRVFKLAHHQLKEPSTTVSSSSTARVFSVNDGTDFEEGDTVYINSEVHTIRQIAGNQIILAENLVVPPSVGDTIKRLSVSGVKINGEDLTYVRDYTYSATSATLTLDSLAEFNIAKAKSLFGTVSFTSGSRNVTGTDTLFSSTLEPGMWVKLATEADWAEILQVVDDTNLILTANCTYTGSGDGQYKAPVVYEEGTSVLVCDVLGKTADGTTSGRFLVTGPDIVRDILIEAGLQDRLYDQSFTDAMVIAPQRLGMVIPKDFSETNTKQLREYITDVNKSIFASLINNKDFELEYQIFMPRRNASFATPVNQYDVLKWAIKTEADRIISTARVRYKRQEADPLMGNEVILEATTDTNTGLYLTKVSKEYVTDTILTRDTDAQLLSDRWAFYFEQATSRITLEAKMLFARNQINDVIDFSHPDLYERVAEVGNRKVSAIESVDRSADSTKVVLVDLANAFSRVCVVMDNTANDFTSSTETERFLGGFVTDQYGMQDNDPDTFNSNLIW